MSRRGVPLYADWDWAQWWAACDLRVPGTYIMTIGDPPRCVVFDVLVDKDLRVTLTLVRGSQFLSTFTLEAHVVPPPLPHAYRRLWNALLDESEAAR